MLINISSATPSIGSLWLGFTDEKDTNSRAKLTILLTILLVLFWLIRATKKAKTPSPPLPPGPLGLPLVGYLPFLGTNLHETFTDLARVYGPIYKLQLGSKLSVVVSSPEIVKQVVRDEDANFVYRDPPISANAITYNLSDIAMGQYGPEWKKLRKIFVREMLSNSILDNCFCLMRDEVKKCVARVFDESGSPINIGELGFSMTVNTVMSMLWGGKKGEELEAKGIDIRTRFREATIQQMELLGKPNVSDLFPFLARFDLQGIEGQAKKNAELFDIILSDVIEQEKIMARGNGENVDEKSKGFLQFLLELRENEDGKASITLNQLKGMLVDIMIGATDTSATTIEWTMASLMQNPEAMKKVQVELEDVVGSNKLVDDIHLPKLHYLSAVTKETMRLHPALPLLIPRYSGQSAIIGGYTIPKHTKVFLNVWAIQRDPKFWDNPLEFKPERFLDVSRKFDYSGNNFLYLPFGSGRRVCAGIPLGEKMLMYSLASMLHAFEWKLPYGVELNLEEKFGIVVKKSDPLVLIPNPRLSKSVLENLKL